MNSTFQAALSPDSVSISIITTTSTHLVRPNNGASLLPIPFATFILLDSRQAHNAIALMIIASQQGENCYLPIPTAPIK